MQKQERNRMPPVPEDLDQRLSKDQRYRLRQLEGFGWRVAFVRRPLFQEITVVLASAEGSQLGILEPDGELNMELNIQVRH